MLVFPKISQYGYLEACLACSQKIVITDSQPPFIDTVLGYGLLFFFEKSVLVKHTNEHPQRVILDTYCHPGGVQRHGILKEPTVKCVNNRLVPHKHILKSSVILFIFSFLPPPHPGCLQQRRSSKGPAQFNGKILQDRRQATE